jgi:hypothetical protein
MSSDSKVLHIIALSPLAVAWQHRTATESVKLAVERIAVRSRSVAAGARDLAHELDRSE